MIKSEKVRIVISLRKDLLDKLEQCSRNIGVSKSTFISLLLYNYK